MVGDVDEAEVATPERRQEHGSGHEGRAEGGEKRVLRREGEAAQPRCAAQPPATAA